MQEPDWPQERFRCDRVHDHRRSGRLGHRACHERHAEGVGHQVAQPRQARRLERDVRGEARRRGVPVEHPAEPGAHGEAHERIGPQRAEVERRRVGRRMVGRGDQHELVGEQRLALEGASAALAGEVAPFGIRVTIVEPGPFRTEFAGRSMQPSTPMAAYAGTPARATRDRFREQDGVQPNDPARAAAAIIATVRAPAAPLRLPLGKEAVARIRAKLERQIVDMESTMDLALPTAYS